MFGRYALQATLGDGGMGRVYRAYDAETDRVVAVKVLHEHIAADPEFRERFRREAHATARLREPHVIPIHRFGEIDGRLYLDMRLIDGIDLHTLLKQRGAMPAPLAVSVIDQAAAALDAAHAEGLVHRDVKPSNLLISGRDFVYLIDFGIAHSAGVHGLTETGSAIGTFAYMAPERFRTGHADARSDVYALACVLYECLTGARPYAGESLEQQLTGHLNTPPPQPSLVHPGVGAAFDEVIARGLAKLPDERYTSAGALATAAKQALAAGSPPITKGPRHSRTAATVAAPRYTMPPANHAAVPANHAAAPAKHAAIAAAAPVRRRRRAVLAVSATLLMALALTAGVLYFFGTPEDESTPTGEHPSLYYTDDPTSETFAPRSTE
ncbi:serine/threonine-protein kinase [Nocardia yamanashiensis]|uniref:serine/threonine-protein kinase n=1 Tax=Nocardia yamanashiensis TaxID=209247 RepID=UPI002FCE5B17